MEKIIKDYQGYAEQNGFGLNPDREVVKRVIKGLLENEKKYGQRYCPCRRVSGNPEEDKPKICPCVWHLEELERDGHCYCRLFVKKIYQCPECGFKYREKEWAEKCEAWCRKYKSCNLEIIKHAVKAQ